MVRYVTGAAKLLPDGTRTGAHSLRQASEFFESKEDRPICINTIRKWLESEGWKPFHRDKGPRIKAINRDQREAYYDLTIAEPAAFWRHVVWSDSTVVKFQRCTNCKNDIYWAKSRADVKPRCRDAHPTTVHCYGALCRFGLLGPIFVVGKITAARYLEEVLPVLIRLVRRKFGDEPFLWQQDKAPAHTANVTQKWCADNLDDWWTKEEWPGCACDISPIEQTWPLVQRAATKPRETTSTELVKDRIRRMFRAYTAEQAIKQLDTMPKKLVVLKERRFWGIPG